MCCDPAISVVVILLFRNDFHVVSAMQSIVYFSQELDPDLSCQESIPPRLPLTFSSDYFPAGSAVSLPFQAGSSFESVSCG